MRSSPQAEPCGHGCQSHGERHGAQRDGRFGHATALRAAQRSWAQRRQIRLRAWSVRRLHGPHRRRCVTLNLKPWVKEHMKKDNDEVLAGKVAFTAGSSCMPMGVPAFMNQGGPNSVYFLQTPKEVWIVIPSNQQVRRVYMD